MSKQIKACLVQHIFNRAFFVPTSNLVNTLSSCSNLNVINGIFDDLEMDSDYLHSYDNAKKVDILHKRSNSFFAAVLRYLYLQLRIMFNIIKISKDFDALILFMESGETFYILLGKLLGKKVYWHPPSDFKKMLHHNNDNKLLSHILILIQKISFILVDNIILYSPNLINEWEMQKYKDKVVFAHAHFIDLNKFTIKKKIKERDTIVGYFGRLSYEKGIINFIKSINEVSKNQKINFTVIGTGDLKDSVLEYINKNNLNNVKVLGWVEDNQIPQHLNEFRLIVLPSYTEGFPYTLLESIACGTPVLGNSVGAIPDVIVDGETGFIMNDNDPKTISYNLVRALKHPNIDNIINNSYNLLKNELNFEHAVKKWENILEK